jgi:hypothetical protein
MNEIAAVSGAEGACFASPCGPAPSVTAAGVRNGLLGIAAAAKIIGEFTKIKQANAVAAVAAAAAWLVSQLEDNDG